LKRVPFWAEQDLKDDFVLFSGAKSKPPKRKRASKLSAIEMLEEKNRLKATIKEKELAQRKQELDLEKQKYEDQAKEREQRLKLELEERRLFLSLLKEKL